jgi:transaldolase
MYVKALAAARTVNTMPESTLNDFFNHGSLDGVLRTDGGTGPATVAALEKAGCSIEKVGNELQVEGAASFVTSWTELMASIQSKSAAMAH